MLPQPMFECNQGIELGLTQGVWGAAKSPQILLSALVGGRAADQGGNRKLFGATTSLQASLRNATAEVLEKR